METIDKTDKAPIPRCNYCGEWKWDKGLTTKDIIHSVKDLKTGKFQTVKSIFTVCKDRQCGECLELAYKE